MTLDLFEPAAVTQKERVNTAMTEIPPQRPGVYTMYDQNDRVLYIGKAKNLYQRVTSYRYSRSRKTQRMIAHVDSIRFEICPSETDAILLENLLIRSLRPPFNQVNKKPEAYYYISMQRNGNKKEFRLSMRLPENPENAYGCFKGHLKTRRGLGALLKLLYLFNTSINSAHYLPAQLLKHITPYRFCVKVEDFLVTDVDEFLKGISTALIQEMTSVVQYSAFKDRFTENYFLNELEQLQMFFTMGPQRNHLVKEKLGLKSHLIGQDELDDLQVYVKTG